MKKVNILTLLFALLFSQEAYVSGVITEFSIVKFVYVQTRVGLRAQRGSERQKEAAKQSNRERIKQGKDLVRQVSKLLHEKLLTLSQDKFKFDDSDIFYKTKDNMPLMQRRDLKADIINDKLLLITPEEIKAREGKKGYVQLFKEPLNIIISFKTIPPEEDIEKIKKFSKLLIKDLVK